jgi:hypothetical protein
VRAATEQVSAWFRTGDARGTRRTQLSTNFHHRDEQPYGGLRPICPSCRDRRQRDPCLRHHRLHEVQVLRVLQAYVQPATHRVFAPCFEWPHRQCDRSRREPSGHLVRFANYGEKRLPSERRETLPSRDVFHNLVMVKWGQLGTGFGMSSSLWVLSSSRPGQNASSAVCCTQPKDSLQARLESVT